MNKKRIFFFASFAVLSGLCEGFFPRKGRKEFHAKTTKFFSLRPSRFLAGFARDFFHAKGAKNFTQRPQSFFFFARNLFFHAKAEKGFITFRFCTLSKSFSFLVSNTKLFSIAVAAMTASPNFKLLCCLISMMRSIKLSESGRI